MTLSLIHWLNEWLTDFWIQCPQGTAELYSDYNDFNDYNDYSDYNDYNFYKDYKDYSE